MNELPPSDDSPDDIDELYRRASALHPGHPSGATRRAVLKHAADFAAEGAVFQIGVGPRRIDILTRIDGVTFQAAYARRSTIRLEGLDVPVISRQDLIANKRASGRTQDLADVERLTARPRSRDDDLTR